LRRYKAKCVKTRCYQEGAGQFEPRFQWRGRLWGIFFGFYKTRHILLSDSANCTVLRAVVLTIPACDRRTDGQTDRRTDKQTGGVAVADTSLVMQALRCAVKIAIFGYPSCLIPPAGGFPWDDLRRIFPGCQRMAKIPIKCGRNIAENFKCLIREGRTRVTDRQTTDDRQTDVRTGDSI